jgi:hypothetical protein
MADSAVVAHSNIRIAKMRGKWQDSLAICMLGPRFKCKLDRNGDKSGTHQGA